MNESPIACVLVPVSREEGTEMDSRDSEKPSGSGPAEKHGLPTVLPSGRRLVLRVDRGAETFEVRSPAGEVELAIEFTEDGPTLRLRGANLILDSSGSVSVNCRDLSVRTKQGIHLDAGGNLSLRSHDEIRVKAAKQAFIDGDYVNLNCLDRTGYHDEGAEYETLGEGEGAAPGTGGESGAPEESGRLSEADGDDALT
jgi:hypothetical protein